MRKNAGLALLRNASGCVINHCLQGQDNSCLCAFASSCERFKSMSNT